MKQTICDGCGEPIDPTVAYYTGAVQQAQEVDGVLSVGPMQQLDWHVDHLPHDQPAPPPPGAVEG